MSESKLKPCHCGAEARIHSIEHESCNKTVTWGYMPYCTNDDCLLSWFKVLDTGFDTEEGAVDAWTWFMSKGKTPDSTVSKDRNLLTLRTKPPGLDDGFRFLTVLLNTITKTYEYSVLDYKQGKGWYYSGGIKPVPEYLVVNGWVKMPPVDDLVKLNDGGQ